MPQYKEMLRQMHKQHKQLKQGPGQTLQVRRVCQGMRATYLSPTFSGSNTSWGFMSFASCWYRFRNIAVTMRRATLKTGGEASDSKRRS